MIIFFLIICNIFKIIASLNIVSLHSFDEKYSNIVKYYYNLKEPSCFLHIQQVDQNLSSKLS